MTDPVRPASTERLTRAAPGDPDFPYMMENTLEEFRRVQGVAGEREPERWATTHGDVVTVWEASPGDWRWHVTAANHEVVEQGEGHPRKAGAVEAAERHHPRVDDPREDIVERVARAMFDADEWPPGWWDSAHRDLCDRFRRLAVAALAAAPRPEGA